MRGGVVEKPAGRPKGLRLRVPAGARRGPGPGSQAREGAACWDSRAVDPGWCRVVGPRVLSGSPLRFSLVCGAAGSGAEGGPAGPAARRMHGSGGFAVYLHGPSEGGESGQRLRLQGSLEVDLPGLRGCAHPVEAAPGLAAGRAAVPSRNREVAGGGGAEPCAVYDGLPFFGVLAQKSQQPCALQEERGEAVGPLPSQRGSLGEVPGDVEGEPSPQLGPELEGEPAVSPFS